MRGRGGVNNRHQWKEEDKGVIIKICMFLINTSSKILTDIIIYLQVRLFGFLLSWIIWHLKCHLIIERRTWKQKPTETWHMYLDFKFQFKFSKLSYWMCSMCLIWFWSQFVFEHKWGICYYIICNHCNQLNCKLMYL